MTVVAAISVTRATNVADKTASIRTSEDTATLSYNLGQLWNDIHEPKKTKPTPYSHGPISFHFVNLQGAANILNACHVCSTRQTLKHVASKLGEKSTLKRRAD